MRDLDSTPQFGHDDRLTIGALNIGTRRAELDFANITGSRGAKAKDRFIMPPGPQSQVRAMVSRRHVRPRSCAA
jgi:hypothetical protein